jgi:hypothetical protein
MIALALIYGWFTEGFNSADLKAAKAPLDELALRMSAYGLFPALQSLASARPE